ncbi:hypothetical protein SAMN05660443_1053 [Marinospirillum celere]|uniref:Outer membrane protein beta-barrel domain-containing protein n=1 Tax=Marinospirillum celere TaxID=1122252 RepID=A0A1I1FJK5_9GAMM|nr:hypothetical protein [Marinospirillum celere]SFB99471.1 hypothetical protein SAMN05660443_1053 [Marinospirillum celere]
MRALLFFLVVSLTLSSGLAKAVALDIYLVTGAGYSDFDGNENAPGAQGQDGVSDANFSLMAGVGLSLGERWTLEASYLEQDLLPTINDAFYGVRGSAKRYLLSYRQPLTQWLQLGIRGGVIDWEYEIRPLAISGTRWESHSGTDPYAGVFLRLGSERGGWLLGYDYSDHDGLEYALFWTGFELAWRLWD